MRNWVLQGELYFSAFALFVVFRPLIVTLVLASLVASSDSPSPVPAVKFFPVIVTSLCEFQLVLADIFKSQDKSAYSRQLTVYTINSARNPSSFNEHEPAIAVIAAKGGDARIRIHFDLSWWH